MRIAVVVAGIFAFHTAHAQGIDRRYAEEPTGGLALPTAGLAGEFDGRVVAMNPGGLSLVRGSELALALNIEDVDVATSAGQGFGAYWAMAGGGRILPRYGLGIGLEWLRPPRSSLTPDPGEPFRFTLGYAMGLGRNAGLGVSWHHFSDDGRVGGVDSFDLGFSARFGNRLAMGAVLRDISTGSVQGVPVQRRYEAEGLTRPFGSDRFELALGGRIGERRAELDGWARFSIKALRGLFVHGMVETREVHALLDSPLGRVEDRGRDLRATIGFEISLGGAGMTVLGTGLRDDRGENHAFAAQTILRVGTQAPESVLPPPKRIERVELTGSIGLRETTSLVARLRGIARDRSVKALVLTFDGATAGWATLQELRNEVLAVRKAGKKVFAYMVSGTGRDYLIASAADRIYIDPAGGLRLVGMAGTTIFFRGAFDQIGVSPQFEKIAEYKTAPEQFTETGPSDAAVRMTTELYDSLWDQWLEQVATGRRITKDELRKIIDNGPYTSGDLAQPGNPASKLVDAVGAPDKVSELVVKELGAVYPVTSARTHRPERWRNPAIAVIYVDGDITDGASRSIPLLGQKLAGGETLVRAIASARANPAVGAIILRIDSPGGSALASELISREIFATRGVKPIVCSMSDLAASGGYFVAAGCERVFAEPMTITGSIGIFYGKFDISGLVKKLGATTDTYKRGQRADVESMFRPYTKEERAVLLDKLRYMYGRFLGAVSEGRGMKKDEVDAVGRGHVWTGVQAKPIKLIDEYGGLGDALDYAKARMGLAADARVQLIELPDVPASLLGFVTNLLGLRAEQQVSITDLAIIKQLLHGVPASVLVDPTVPQARMPFDLAD